ncbi:hypothetical protein ABZ951_32050 [Streptomyces sp. NPDC046215]|uniref:hypothetical protein n=1 Tax=Streptomyces TaxID=1883 RepID=UPI0031D0F7DD
MAGPGSNEVPAGTTAGIVVFDRRSNTFAERLNADAPFRSASVVKLLIALDHLWHRGPAFRLTPADRARLELMLARSDDGAAGHYWDHNGRSAIITRMVTRLGLTGTAGPPPAFPEYWGYSALTAADTVRIYRHLLDAAPDPVRELVMGGLRRCTRLGTDGFDQHFGIAAAFGQPWAVKQGWSGFPPSGRTAGADHVDLARPALHTTGTVGAGDRSVVAVLTLHPAGTPYTVTCSRVTALTRALDVPGAVRPVARPD